MIDVDDSLTLAQLHWSHRPTAFAPSPGWRSNRIRTMFDTTGELMAITASEARRNLRGLIERVNLDHTEVEITSKRGSAVLMSKDEFDSLVETSYLLRSPENARRLLSAMERARAGEITERQPHDS